MNSDKRRYFRLGAAVFSGLAGAILFFFFLLRFRAVEDFLGVILSALQPLFVGIVLAYLLYPAARFLEKRCSRIKAFSRIARPFSVLATLVLAAGMLGIFCALALP